MTARSPFYVVENFFSPLRCEDLLVDVDFNVPDTDKDGRYILTTKTSEKAESMVFSRLHANDKVLQAACDLHGIKYKGTTRMTFEWYPEGTAGKIRTENSDFVSGKWLRTRARDLTGVLFLSDYQEKTPFDHEYEVYGGKLEFPAHKFGFNPQRGTLVLFPSDPRFMNIVSPIYAGDLYQVRFHVTAVTPYIYNPTAFPGTYLDWFSSSL